MKTITQKKLAQLLDVDPSFLCKMLRGDRRPSPHMAAKLEQITGIGIRVWLYEGNIAITDSLEKIYGRINRKVGRPLLKKNQEEQNP